MAEPENNNHRCLDGRTCYYQSFQLTISACCLALILGLYAGFRDARKARASATSKIINERENDRMEETAWVE